ncbi:MAG: hypothetical protein KDC61_02055, partial [Saprospiraceae bacterium]|nr:hypothetical protein [Saprospiraceae bacterium]
GAFIMAIYYGMGDGRLRIAIDHEVSHMQVHRPGFSDDQEARMNFDADRVEQALQNLPDVKAYALRSITGGMLATASGSQGVQINGIDPASEEATLGLNTFVR